MEYGRRWMIVALIIAGLQLVACTRAPAKPAKIEPARIEKIAQSDLKRVVLTEKAAERIGIQTASVREEQVARKRTAGGKVVTLAGASVIAPAASPVPVIALGPSKLAVLVPLNDSDLEMVDRAKPALVLSLLGGSSSAADSKVLATARSFEAPVPADPEEASEALYFAVDGPGQGLVPDQRVFVELTLLGGGRRLIVPHSAVIYDVKGATWTYTSTGKLEFVRHLVNVEYIDGDLAILAEGPPPGTEVVIVGTSELFGAETGIGK